MREPGAPRHAGCVTAADQPAAPAAEARQRQGFIGGALVFGAQHWLHRRRVGPACRVWLPCPGRKEIEMFWFRKQAAPWPPGGGPALGRPAGRGRRRVLMLAAALTLPLGVAGEGSPALGAAAP